MKQDYCELNLINKSHKVLLPQAVAMAAGANLHFGGAHLLSMRLGHSHERFGLKSIIDEKIHIVVGARLSL